MKKLFIFQFIFVLLFFCSCSKNNTSNALNNVVAYDLEQIDKDKNLNIETLKALSVIFRTNHKINNDYLNKKYNSKTKYNFIAKQTSNELLKNNGNLVYISFDDNDSRWIKSVSKNDILNYSQKNNLSLTNISNIELDYENDKLKNLIIGGKQINYENFANNFNLSSNKITDVKNENNSIVFSGKGKGFFPPINIDEIKELNKNYNDILEFILEKN